jgi:2-polyprenyl-3-methyl-5-hydroxy-6-metoxy-1,4-benzoquinol methylase
MLDLGCGAGDFMAAARALGYEVEGIDISEASVEICRAKHLDARVADFLTCDLPVKFDLVTMWDVIAHIRNPADFLSRVRSVLSKRGVLFVKTPAFGDFSVALSNSWPMLAGTLLGAPSHCQFFNPKSLHAALSRAGFESDWMRGGRSRSARTGGSVKRRVARQVRALLGSLSGDSNLYVVARPAADHMPIPEPGHK